MGAVGDNLLLALLLTGLTSVLLGMEVPTTAAYIVAVVVGGPVLEGFGVPPLAGHLFIFYLAILSAITPPVCGAVFIAAGMAGADWVQTAKVGLRLAFAAFILPFLFAYQPGLLLIGGLGDTIWAFVTGFIAMALISAGFMGYLRPTWAPWPAGPHGGRLLLPAQRLVAQSDRAVMAGAVWLGNRPRPGRGKEGCPGPGVSPPGRARPVPGTHPAFPECAERGGRAAAGVLDRSQGRMAVEGGDEDHQVGLGDHPAETLHPAAHLAGVVEALASQPLHQLAIGRAEAVEPADDDHPAAGQGAGRRGAGAAARAGLAGPAAQAGEGFRGAGKGGAGENCRLDHNKLVIPN